MLPVIVPPIRKGICRFIIDFKIESNYYYYIIDNILYIIVLDLKIRNRNIQI